MLTAMILSAVVLVALLLLYPRLANAPVWRANTTPLASIIGSGFLVLGPILNARYGLYAPLVMLLLCLVAWLFGMAVRFNIAAIADAQDGSMDGAGPGQPQAATIEGGLHRPHIDIRGLSVHRIETVASWCLAFAYIISVGYYLNLFGAFAVSLTPFDGPLAAKLVTSAIFLLILVVGWLWGFHALERLEQVSVGIKLAIIAGLLVGLADFFRRQVGLGALSFNPSELHGWAAITTGFGLIVTVQGFETSRYLKASYDAPTRIRSMRLAQVIATLIYMAYIGLMAYVFTPGEIKLDETAIIDMMRIVAPILPALLVAAALSAQFSAAVADTGGAGGLIAELTRRRLSPRQAYAVLVALGLALTWSANLFEIISYASRAFAGYYALQALIAGVTAWNERAALSGGRIKAAGFTALALLGFAIAVFGQPVE